MSGGRLVHVNTLGEPGAQWREAFRTAAEWFAATSAAAAGHLQEPGLGVWTVHDLVGHTSRALSTVRAYLAAEPEHSASVESAVDYFRVAVTQADPAQVAERGRRAGTALGPEPSAAVATLVTEVTDTVRAAADDARVHTPFGAMTLAEYLPTRTFELTVHTCDLASALGQPLATPPAAAASALRLAAALCVANGSAGEVLLGMTGRRGLPHGFSVL